MASYTFQLVLQLPSVALNKFDEMVALEDAIIDCFSAQPHAVDGHDVGSGTINFFIHTDDPSSAFALAIQAFAPSERAVLKAAFRRFNGGDYTTIWPQDSLVPFQLI